MFHQGIMKLVILDRDGTINYDSDEYIKSPEEWRPLPGALEAISRLNHAGYHVVIASNQSGLGRGLLDVASLNAIHKRMLKQLAAVGGRIDAIFYCPHAPTDGCTCRKPMPGLIEQVAERFGIEVQGVPFVGDTLTDMQAAMSAGCAPHLVLTGKSEALKGSPLPSVFPTSTQVHTDLNAFVDVLLKKSLDPAV
jgi:D-glycero-D-manno-heptose 1,7-bisphosphate phosphatase